MRLVRHPLTLEVVSASSVAPFKRLLRDGRASKNSSAVPRHPEVLSGQSGASEQLTAASGQRRTSTEVLERR